jgi:hypothetical protein
VVIRDCGGYTLFIMKVEGWKPSTLWREKKTYDRKMDVCRTAGKSLNVVRMY